MHFFFLKMYNEWNAKHAKKGEGIREPAFYGVLVYKSKQYKSFLVKVVRYLDELFILRLLQYNKTTLFVNIKKFCIM